MPASVTRSVTLSPDLSEVVRARELVRQVATGAGFADTRVFDITVVVSEAAANAIEHAPVKGRVTVTTFLHADRLEIQVSGPGEFQAPSRLAQRSPRGLGLPLMATLSDHLALYSRPSGGTLVSLTFYRPDVRLAEEGDQEAPPLPPSVHELLESHDHLRTILDTSPTAVSIVDSTGTITYTNRRARELYGHEAAGVSLDDHLQQVQVLHPDGWLYPRDDLPVSQALEHKRVVRDVEMSMLRPDGQRIHVSVSCAPLLDPEGVVTGAVALFEDITGRRSAEEALRESEERHRIVADFTLGWEFWMSPDQRFLYVSPAVERITGYPRDAFMSDPGLFLRIVHPDDRPAVEDHLRDLEGPEVTFEFRIVRADGEECWLEHSCQEVRGEDGRFFGRRASNRDITARRSRECDLGRQAELMDLLLERIPFMLVMYDPRLRRFTLNRHAEEVLGWSADDANDGDFMSKVYPDAAIRAEAEAFMQSLAPGWREFAVTGKDGRTVPSNWANIRLADDTMIGIGVDLTDRVRAQEQERELLANQAERARLAAASNLINDVTGSSLEVDEMLRRVLTQMNAALATDSSAIAMRGEGYWEVRRTHGFDDDLRGVRLPDAEVPFTVQAEQVREPVVIQDVDSDDRVDLEVMRRYGVRSVVAAPLIVRGQVIGALFVNHRRDAIPFTPPQVDFVRRTATAMSLAIETANAFDSLRRELARSRLLSEVAAVLASSLEAQPMAESLLDAIDAHLDLHLGSFYALEPEGRTLEHLAFRGYSAQAQASSSSVPVDEHTLLGHALSKRLAYLTHESLPYPGVHRPAPLAEVSDDRWIILPLRVGEQLLGGMVLAFPGRRPFQSDEISLFQTIASLVSIALRNARLYEEQKAIAQNLQSALLNIPSEIGRVRLGHLYRSATEAALVGGDFYDVFEVKDGQIAIMIGDVAGHGIKAARTATLVKDVVHAFTHRTLRTDEVLRRTNHVLVEKDIPGFVSLFLGILDGRTGRMRYVSAGHPETLLRRTSGEIEWLGTGSAPLGVFPAASWTATEVHVAAGDVLLLYTDGVLEARRDGEFFGEDRLEDVVRRGRIAPERLPHLVLEQVLAFSGGRLTDDVALLALTLEE